MEDAGTFWSHESPGGELQSSIDKLLSVTEPDLEELLANDEIIQECKYMNESLTDYLSKKNILTKLIHYTIDIPEDANQKAAERFPYVASELFACEVTSMLQGVVRDENIMNLLFSFIVKKQSCDPRHSGYFRKVVGVLIQRTYKDLEAYLKEHTEVVLGLARNMHLYVVMELLVMIGWDVTTTTYDRDVKWLADAGLIPALLDQLDSKHASSDAHVNTANALCTLVQVCGAGMNANALLSHLESSEMSRRLATLAISTTPGKSSLSALSVIRTMVSRLADVMADQKSNEVPPVVSIVLKVVLPHSTIVLGDSDSKKLGTIQLQYGTLSPPLGELRLEHVRLLAALVRMPLKAVEEGIHKSKIIEVSMMLMLQYPFHNILHNLLREIVCTIIERGPSDLRDSALMKNASLPKCIIQGFKAHQERITKCKADRMGYTGHLLAMASALEEIAGRDTELRKALMAVEGWKGLMDGYVSQEIKKQEMTLGGRRPNAHLQDSDDDLEPQTMGKIGEGGLPGLDHPTQTMEANDSFGSFEEEWESQGPSTSGAFAQEASERGNTWASDDPFAIADPANSSTESPFDIDKAADTNDDFAADFEEEFESQDFVPKESKSEVEKQVEAKEPKNDAVDSTDPGKLKEAEKKKADEAFADFEAAFGD